MEMTFNSEVVRELRSKANWSQEDLAAASGLSLRAIQRVENAGEAGLETRKALAASLRASAHWLVWRFVHGGATFTSQSIYSRP